MENKSKYSNLHQTIQIQAFNHHKLHPQSLQIQTTKSQQQSIKNTKIRCQTCFNFTICPQCKIKPLYSISSPFQQHSQQLIHQINTLLQISQSQISQFYNQLEVINQNTTNYIHQIFQNIRKFVNQLQLQTTNCLRNNLIKFKIQINQYQRYIQQIQNQFNQSSEYSKLNGYISKLNDKQLYSAINLCKYEQSCSEISNKINKFYSQLRWPFQKIIDKKRSIKKTKLKQQKQLQSRINPILQQYIMKNIQNNKASNPSFIKTLNLISKPNILTELPLNIEQIKNNNNFYPIRFFK